MLNVITNTISNIRIWDIIDILVVAVVFYKLYMLMKETRAEQLLKGIGAIFVVALLSQWFKLYTINWILQNAMQIGLITLVIVFQPELRRMLEYIGRSNILKKSLIDVRGEEMQRLADEIVNATASLSRQKIGALIVFERHTGLSEVVETGTKLNAEISSELLINIFIPNTPLHDGAVVIKGDIIRAAACFLPLTDNQTISKELGTRHRAGIGISEKSDCLVLIVSEETGGISIAENGKITRYVDVDTLREILLNMYEVSDNGLFDRWRSDNGKN
ncbi:MAG: TIGR00159 family protein [Tissierellia bacterium]|nr:TIGR00159 family protein [Tissierellia bacterium]